MVGILARKRTQNPQAIGADINEIRLGYYLTNNWDDFEDPDRVKNQHDTRRIRISSQEYEDQDERAQEQAREVIKWMDSNGYDTKIVKKWWPKQNSAMISKALSYQVDLKKIPIDILIKTDKGKFLGISAKSGKGKARIPFKNKGLGTVEKELGIELKCVYEKEKERLLQKFPKLPWIQAERKKWFKKYENFYDENISGSDFVKNTFSGIRNKLLDKLSNMTKDELWIYIRDNWLDARKTKLQYIIVTGRGERDKYSADVAEPQNLDPRKLNIKLEDYDRIKIYSNDVHVFNMRVKFESTQMATSIKFSGE